MGDERIGGISPEILKTTYNFHLIFPQLVSCHRNTGINYRALRGLRNRYRHRAKARCYPSTSFALLTPVRMTQRALLLVLSL
jgi:hypothetical protein